MTTTLTSSPAPVALPIWTIRDLGALAARRGDLRPERFTAWSDARHYGVAYDDGATFGEYVFAFYEARARKGGAR